MLHQPCSAPAALLIPLFQEIKFQAQPCLSLMSTSSTSTTLRTRWRSRPCSGPRAAMSPPATGTLSATTTTAPCWMAPGSSPRACPEHSRPSWGQTPAGIELAPSWHRAGGGRAPGSTGTICSAELERRPGQQDGAAGRRVRGTQWDGCGTSWHARMEDVGRVGISGLPTRSKGLFSHALFPLFFLQPRLREAPGGNSGGQQGDRGAEQRPPGHVCRGEARAHRSPTPGPWGERR